MLSVMIIVSVVSRHEKTRRFRLLVRQKQEGHTFASALLNVAVCIYAKLCILIANRKSLGQES